MNYVIIFVTVQKCRWDAFFTHTLAFLKGEAERIYAYFAQYKQSCYRFKMFLACIFHNYKQAQHNEMEYLGAEQNLS